MAAKKQNALTDEQKQKWQDIFANHEPKTASTMYALHTVAQHWVETEVIIEKAAVQEADENGPKWTPDYDDRDSVGEFFSERDMARYMHDKIMVPMHRYSCIVKCPLPLSRGNCSGCLKHLKRNAACKNSNSRTSELIPKWRKLQNSVKSSTVFGSRNALNLKPSTICRKSATA